MSAPSLIENISDTARWVAFYRAMESERPDAHFHDPHARKLAGARGEEIVRRLRYAKASAWAMVVRTCVFDEFIERAVARDGVDTVLNLAAGLDARPYRMRLPASLRWIEVDLAPMLSYKEQVLVRERPACQLERIKMDLADVETRRALFARVGGAGRQVLVITEGLLTYLTAEQVASLADDLYAPSSFRWWIVEVISPLLLKRLRKMWDRQLAAANARMQFAPEEGVEFFRPHGWKVGEFRSTWDEAQRLKREMRMAWLIKLMNVFASKARREAGRKMSALVLLERS